MTAIAGDLTQKILGHSDADKAFRPWWDNLEDGVLYSFVVMGMFPLSQICQYTHLYNCNADNSYFQIRLILL